MIYNNTVSDIESSVLEPWRMCGEYKDGLFKNDRGGDRGRDFDQAIHLQKRGKRKENVEVAGRN